MDRAIVRRGKSPARSGIGPGGGATVFARNQRVVLDGPYPESKEAVCGTLVLEVANLDEAIAIAKACPSLRYDSALEIRPISDACPLETCARTKEQAEQRAPVCV